jgi:ENTS family enterobactin (siderophore) exporter
LRRQLFGIERNGQLLFLATLLNGLAEGLWRYILPVHVGELGATPSQIGLVLSLSSVSMVLSYLPVGVLSDRISRRSLLISSRGVMAAGALAMAMARGWKGIMPGLSLFYFGWFSYPVISGYLAQVYRKDNPAAAFTSIFAGYSIGLIITPSVGGAIAGQRGMPMTFMLSAALLLVSAFPVFFLEPQRPGSPTPLSAYRELFSHQILRGFILYVAALATLLYAGQVLAPNFLQDVAGLGLAEIGSLGTAASAGTAAFNFLLGRVRPRRALQLIMGGMTLSILMLVALPGTNLVWVCYLLFGLVGTVSFLSAGLMAPWVPARTTGLAYAIQGLTMVISMVLGPAAAGLLYDRSPFLPFFTVAIGLMVFMIWTARMHLRFIDESDPLPSKSPNMA